MSPRSVRRSELLGANSSPSLQWLSAARRSPPTISSRQARASCAARGETATVCAQPKARNEAHRAHARGWWKGRCGKLPLLSTDETMRWRIRPTLEESMQSPFRVVSLGCLSLLAIVVVGCGQVKGPGSGGDGGVNLPLVTPPVKAATPAGLNGTTSPRVAGLIAPGAGSGRGHQLLSSTDF